MLTVGLKLFYFKVRINEKMLKKVFKVDSDWAQKIARCQNIHSQILFLFFVFKFRLKCNN